MIFIVAAFALGVTNRKKSQQYSIKSVIFANHFIFMKKYFFMALTLVFFVMIFVADADVYFYEDNFEEDNSYISDRQKSDIESIFNIASSSKTVLPELRNYLPLLSFRLVSSHKKIQQNSVNNIILRRFSSEVQPTKDYNAKFSFPLSSKEDLIVIVRHLII